MTTNNFLGKMGGAARLLSVAMLCIAGCSSGNSGKGPAESSGSHWLACSDDGDCAAQGASSTCGAKGVCVDRSGTPIEVMVTGGTGGSGGPGATAGVGGSSGVGGVGGTGGSGYDPCAGKSCADVCQTCPPGSKDCVEGKSVKTCDATGTCTVSRTSCPGGSADAGIGIADPSCESTGIGEGAPCGGPADQATPACCTNAGVELQCSIDVCTNSIPGSCTGTFNPVVGSTACGGS